MNNNTKENKPYITGNDLRLAREIYGFKSQREFADYLREHGHDKMSMATVQRIEKMDKIESDVLGFYTLELKWQLTRIKNFIESVNQDLASHQLEVKIDESVAA
jgi:hypothetical protein